MKRRDMIIWVIFAVLQLVVIYYAITLVRSQEVPTTYDQIEQQIKTESAACLPISMIAFDSVTNKNVGMLPENQIFFFGTDFKDSVKYGSVVLGAYLWEGGAHEYARYTFTKCILKNRSILHVYF